MKTTKIFCLLFTCVLFFTNCKKDSPGSQNNDPAAVDANGNIVLNSDADGAFYSVISRYYDDNSGSTYDDLNFAYAWFGKFPTVKDAGTTTVNSFELTNIGGVNYYTYVGFDPLFPGNSSKWEVAGNTANGITGFSYTDNTAYPSGGTFVLPAKIDISKNLTVSYAAVTNVMGVIYTIQGNKSHKSKAVKDGGSSVTFTAAELTEVAYPSDEIAVSIMPVIATPTTINGKKYYFVKQFQYLRGTETL